MPARTGLRAALAALGAAVLGGLAITACGPTTAPTSSAAGAPTWLCNPLHPVGDPCLAGRTVTAISAAGERSAADPPAPGDPQRYDCFYVYPTVSHEPVTNADLKVQPAEVATARTQVAPFSSVCSVWAPMYRQVTLQGLPGAFDGSSASDVAYRSLRSAFDAWLATRSDGRPIIFIGHSQGAALLVRLLHDEVDPDPALRARTVSAILLGGNVTVSTGRTTGGSFRHLPLCTAPAQVGCVIAYSTFPGQPPAGALFGRPGQGISELSDTTARSHLQVACTNPARLAGGGQDLFALFPTSAPQSLGGGIKTPFVTYPGLYRAGCRTAGGATWLQIDTSRFATDHRPRVGANLGPDWGYHTSDLSLAFGDLVDIVAGQEAAWSSR